MLFNGTLSQPIDIFDLVLHGGPLGFLLIRVGADVVVRMNKPESGTT